MLILQARKSACSQIMIIPIMAMPTLSLEN